MRECFNALMDSTTAAPFDPSRTSGSRLRVQLRAGIYTGKGFNEGML